MFCITSHWKLDELTPAEIGQRSLTMLQRLGHLGAPMGNWLLGDPALPRWSHLDEVVHGITGVVQRNVMRDDFGDPEPGSGYRVIVKGSKTPSEFGASDSANITVKAGSKWRNSVEFELGSFQTPPDLNLVTYSLFKGAVETMASIWPCPWMFAYTWTPDDVPRVPWDGVTPIWEWKSPKGRMRRSFEIAWVAYLSAPLAKGLAPPPEIICEPTPAGGVILSSAPERLDEANPDHMRRALALEALLDERIGSQGYGPDRVEHPARVGPY